MGEARQPLRFVGPKRVNPPGIAFDELPPIDAVLITHNHYDHLDAENDRAAVAAATGRASSRRSATTRSCSGYDERIAVESRRLGAVGAISATASAVHVEPAQHWSARGVYDRRMALWCAFVVRRPRGAIYYVGDSGYGDGASFAPCARASGAPPGAAADRRLRAALVHAPQHMNPEEAVRGVQKPAPTRRSATTGARSA